MDADFRLQLAASALAPVLRDALAVLEEQPSTSFADLPRYERDLWCLRAAAVLEFFASDTIHDRMQDEHEAGRLVAASHTDFFQFAAQVARQQFTPIKGGKRG